MVVVETEASTKYPSNYIVLVRLKWGGGNASANGKGALIRFLKTVFF